MQLNKVACATAILFVSLTFGWAQDQIAEKKAECPAKDTASASKPADIGTGDGKQEYEIAYQYITGKGAEKNVAEGCRWLKLAAEHGDVRAQYTIGLRYLKGEGVPQSDVEGAKWMRIAAHRGVPAAQYSLAIRYVEGKGIPQDYVEAYKWFVLAQKSGKKQAAKNLEHLAKDGVITSAQVEEAKARAAEFVPHPMPD